MTLQNDFFKKNYSQLMRHPLIELFHLSNLLQMPNDHRMVNAELFSNFLCSCKRISFSDGSQFVVVNFRWLATVLLVFKVLVSFAKLPEPPLCCMFARSSWAEGDVDVVSCLQCFTIHFELK